MSPPDVSGTLAPSEETIKYLDRAEGYVALSDPRRRYVLHILAEAEESLTLLDLAREIVRMERDDADDVDEEETEQVLITLYHIHVPKLADAGFVRYNTDEQRVTLAAGAPLDFVEKMEE